VARTLIIGDVHGCADELRAMLAQAQADRVILVGDLFSKGPDPLGVWALIQEHRCEAVLGNHDALLLAGWQTRSKSLAQLPEAAHAYLTDLPLFKLEPGLIVVHAGLNPLHGVGGTTRAHALNLRRWPNDRECLHAFWYDAGWKGPQTVVFGHDARRQRIRRECDGRVVAIGLDSGCVYGGELSGWLFEEDELFIVPAARAYREVG
jgi:predicted phosphodiesterase